ncbi:MAG TPA: cation:dicarboxylase symporter family transporter [Candidatus Megamonas gallistercoris]|nr:cation:dicarboxylase symporter family transporter [Candidatus Megamonas gallistercoris]
MKKIRMGLTTQIFLGLLLGACFGYFLPEIGSQLKPLGDAFIRMIKMIVVPLIFSTLIVGIAGTGDFKKLGRLGGKAIIWFEVASALALIVGLVVVNVLQPGVGVSLPSIGAAAGANAAATAESFSISMHLLNIIPTNIVEACAKSDMLQIIFFSCFFGVAVAHIGEEKGKLIVDVCRCVCEAMFKVTHYVMLFAPIGIFAMISYTVGTFGLEMLIPLGKLVFSLYFAIIVFLCILSLIASVITKLNFWHIFKVLREPLLLGYSTASSEAALPLAMKCLERLGLPKQVITFVMPTGYSFNLDGSTLYSSLAVIFLAQMYDIEFGITQHIMMLLTLMISTKGIAGVPGASIIVIAGTAASFGIPTEGIAIILGVDRIMDMARTFCNIFGNCIATVVVGLWEREIKREEIKHAYKNIFIEN